VKPTVKPLSGTGSTKQPAKAANSQPAGGLGTPQPQPIPANLQPAGGLGTPQPQPIPANSQPAGGLGIPAPTGAATSVLVPASEEDLDEAYEIAGPRAAHLAMLESIKDDEKKKIIKHVKSRLDHYLLVAARLRENTTDLTHSASLDANPHQAEFQKLKAKIEPRLLELQVFEEYLSTATESERKKFSATTIEALAHLKGALEIMGAQQNKHITHIHVGSQQHKILTINTDEKTEDFNKKITEQIKAFLGDTSTTGLAPTVLANDKDPQRLSDFADKQVRVTCKSVKVTSDEGAATFHKIVAVQRKSESGTQFSSTFYMQPGFFTALETGQFDKGFNLPHDGYLDVAQAMYTDYKKANPNFMHEKKFYIRDEGNQFPKAMIEALMIVAAHEGVKGINQTKQDVSISQYQIDRYSKRVRPKDAKNVVDEPVANTKFFTSTSKAMSKKEEEKLIEKTKGPTKSG